MTEQEAEADPAAWFEAQLKAERRRSTALRSWLRFALRNPDNAVALKAALAADDRRLKRAKAGRP